MENMRIKGATYGFAYGDAWGKDPEFFTHAQILNRRPNFPQKAMVTDDTQMSLYALYAIMFEIENQRESVQQLHMDGRKRNHIRRLFADSFVEFANDPDNNRAPGQTCMRALKTYERQLHLQSKNTPVRGDEGVDVNSKGCGANMRVGWFGLLPLPEEDIINLAVIQSETTHGHPLALSSSVLTALTVKAIYNQEIQSGKETYLNWVEAKIRQLNDDMLLKEDKAPASWSVNYREGLTQLLAFIENIRNNVEAFKKSTPDDDICNYFGGGWVAEEAFINGLLTADYLSATPVEAVRRLVYSSGDSDSIAAFGGMFIGVEKGFQIYPADWEQRLETRYTAELQEVTQFLNRVN
jgi:ADP-ribosylglycohydrolase